MNGELEISIDGNLDLILNKERVGWVKATLIGGQAIITANDVTHRGEVMPYSDNVHDNVVAALMTLWGKRKDLHTSTPEFFMRSIGRNPVDRQLVPDRREGRTVTA